ncbi:MAG: ERAP1-like C-terminal domain-containing protein [Woeseiaceae bacterium]|nr:ERAP1-like C-terminal domain-containing protein [Woeseiaceae bacterium]
MSNHNYFTSRRVIMKSLLLTCLLPFPLFVVVGCNPSRDAGANSVSYIAPAGKLPGGVRPQAYRLNLLLDPRRDDFSGRVEIDVQLESPTKRIWLHGEDLRVAKVRAILPAGQEVAADYEEFEDSGVASLSFADEVPAGFVTLSLQYSAAFNRNLAGLFKVEEQGDAYVLAKTESIQARKYLPGFDEPGLKATFDIVLTIPAGYVAISNAPEISRKPEGEGLESVTFATTRPMPTYLLSLSVGPFDIVERAAIPPSEFRSRPVQLRGIARKGRGADMNYILDITPRMVEIFERQLQRPYPYQKLDIVAAPQWPSGATELSAAITYREQTILLGDEPAPGARLSLLQVHAHELSHMWFGNLVTPPWWDDLWLKEGIASWSEPVILRVFEPDGGHDLDALVSSIGAMLQDSLASTRAIREPIAENSNIRNAYDSITYSKSLGVIHMVDQYFGAEKFRSAMGRYVEAFADGVADSSDFYAVIGEETNTPELTETFRSFVEQKGVPLLDLELQCGGESSPMLQIHQRRYKPLGSSIVDSGQKWTVPVCLRSDRVAQQCLMLTESDQAVRLQGESCPQWLLPNAGGSGYYRWNMAEAQWQGLLQNFTEFKPAEALSIIDSAFAAYEAGTLSESVLLQVVQQSAKSDKRQVLMAPLAFLQKYHRNYLGSADQPAFLQFAQALYQPVLDRTADSSSRDQQLLHRELMNFMALTAKDPDARRQMLAKAYAFTGFGVMRDARALDSDLYSTALTVALQDSGGAFLPHLLKVRSELDDPLFERASADAIGSNLNPDQLDQIHDLVLSDEIGAREAVGLMHAALLEPELREQHWQWFVRNFVAVVAKIPEQSRRNTPALASAFCDADKIEELRQLFREHGGLTPGYLRSLSQTEEQIQLCVALRERGRAFASILTAQ